MHDSTLLDTTHLALFGFGENMPIGIGLTLFRPGVVQPPQKIVKFLTISLKKQLLAWVENAKKSFTPGLYHVPYSSQIVWKELKSNIISLIYNNLYLPPLNNEEKTNAKCKNVDLCILQKIMLRFIFLQIRSMTVFNTDAIAIL